MTDDVLQSPPLRYLTTQEAADYLRLKKNSLEKMRWRQSGPMFRHHGRNVVYAIEDLDIWSDERTSHPTSDPGAKEGEGMPGSDAPASDSGPESSGPDARHPCDV